MKKLKLKSLKVISTKDEEAKIINFGDRVTVFTSEEYPKKNETENHTGKSLITKSIYYSLGADLAKYTDTWQDLKLATIIEFEYNNFSYSLFRQGKKFVLINKITDGIKVFNSPGELKDFYKDLFDIKLQLVLKKTEENAFPYPQALFLPFYIDQDTGWATNWRSFKMEFYKSPNKEIFEFYTGAKTNDYYLLLEKKAALEKIKTEIKKQNDTFQIVIDENINNFKEALCLNVDINDFKKEIGLLIAELNKIQSQKEKLKSNLLNLNNKKSELSLNIDNHNKILKDLKEDEKYIKKQMGKETIKCPICSTEHSNNDSVRYIFNLDIENCQKDIHLLIKEREKIIERIKEIAKDLDNLVLKENKVNSILNKKKKTIKLRDVLLSQGVHEIIKNFQKKQTQCNNTIEEKNTDIKQINSELNYYSENQKKVNDKFLEILTKYIAKLGITDIRPKKIGENNSAGGSDLPRGMLAYTLTYYKMLYDNKDAIVLPLIIDTLVQQDPSSTNIKKMFNLLLEECPEDCQLILSTTNLHDVNFGTTPYRFTKKRKVLEKGDYEIVKEEYFNFLELIRKASFK